MIITKIEQLEIMLSRYQLPEFAHLYRCDGSASFPVRDSNNGMQINRRMIFLYSTIKHSIEVQLPIDESDLKTKIIFHLKQFAREISQLIVEIEDET